MILFRVKLSASAIVALALVLSACGQPAATAPTAETEVAVTRIADAKTPAAAGALTPAMLVGRWGDNGDCAKDIAFNADGTFSSYTGGGGTWSLNGDRMSMSGAGGTFEVGVEILNNSTLLVHNPDGSVGTSQRC